MLLRQAILYWHPHCGFGDWGQQRRSGALSELCWRSRSNEAGDCNRVAARVVTCHRTLSTRGKTALSREKIIREKILSREQLRQRAAEWRAAGESLTLPNGGFDLVHVGHVLY